MKNVLFLICFGTLCLFLSTAALPGCDTDSDAGDKLGGEGESCIEKSDCEDGLDCIDSKCVASDDAGGDADTDSDSDADSDADTDSDADADGDAGVSCTSQQICDKVVTDCQDPKSDMPDCLKFYDDPSSICTNPTNYIACLCGCLSQADCGDFDTCNETCYLTHCLKSTNSLAKLSGYIGTTGRRPGGRLDVIP